MSLKQTTIQSGSKAKQSEPKTGCLRRVGRLATGFLLLLVILALLGMGYEAIASARDRRQFPPPGQLVQVNDHRLHLYCLGDGSPTVIIEAGSGGLTLDWRTVQTRVAAFTRVCTYERAGYGWSEAGPEPRSGSQIVAELHALLENAGESGPYLLVGHSLGGMYARLYAAAYPSEVAGVLLLDARHEAAGGAMPAAVAEAEAQVEQLYNLAPLLIRLGVGRLLIPRMVSPPAPLPDELHAAYEANLYRPNFYRAMNAELHAIEQTEQQLRDAGSLGDIPLVVVRRGRPQPNVFNMTPEEVEQGEQAWRELQEALATLSHNSQLLVATESGHLIHQDQPELVVELIQSMIAGQGR